MEHDTTPATHVRAVWTPQQPWPDFPDVTSAGVWTVVSKHGTARIIDHHQGLHRRAPLEGGHRLPSDRGWSGFSWVQASPCGLNIQLGVNGVERGTPIRAVFQGTHPHWLHLPEGPRLLDTIIARTPIAAIDHPPGACGAAFCLNRPHRQETAHAT